MCLQFLWLLEVSSILLACTLSTMDSANSPHNEEQQDSWCYEQDLPDSDLLWSSFAMCSFLLYSKVIQFYISTYIYIILHILFHCGLSSQGTEYSYCAIKEACCLSTLNTIVFIC